MFKILTFKVNFLYQKNLNLSKIFFYWRIAFVEQIFCYWHFFTTSIFKPLYLLKWRNFYSSDQKNKTFLRDWLLVLGLEEGLVECATLCVKSWVILCYVFQYYKVTPHVMDFFCSFWVQLFNKRKGFYNLQLTLKNF